MSPWNWAKLDSARRLSLFAICLLPMALFAGDSRGCAAFSKSGTLAQVTVDTALHVSGMQEHERAAKIDIPLKIRTADCKAFFSADSKLLAIGPESLSGETAAIVMLDVSTTPWRESSTMSLKLAKDSRGELMGFIGDTYRLLIVGKGVYFPAQHETTLFPVLVDVSREKAVTKVVPIGAQAFSRTDSVIDLRTSTVWVPSSGDTPCLMRGYSLNESTIPGVKDIAIPNCFSIDLLMAAEPHLIIAATHSAGTTQLHAIDTASGLEKKVGTLNAHGSTAYLVDGDFSSSPDGLYLAISAKRLESGFLGNSRFANELLLIDAKSLTVQASIAYSERPRKFAVSASGGSLEIATLTGSGWSFRTVSLRGVSQ